MDKLQPTDIDSFLNTLKVRFQQNMSRHKDLDWSKIQIKLESNLDKLNSLYLMEITGGQPDVVDFDSSSDSYVFYDTSAETPSERCSLCYDDEALQSRKTNKPRSSAIQMAQEMGVELLNEEQYKYLQTLGEFDLKTSSWISTPPSIRLLKGAIFADRRYNEVFIYHNGAESYYASRGFRALLIV